MVEADRRDGRERRGDDIGRIQPPAKANFEDEIIGGVFAKSQKRSRRGDFKKCNRTALIGRLEPRQHIRQTGLRNLFAAQEDTLVKAHQMRRVIGMHNPAIGLQHGAQHGGGRAFAVGAGNMNDRRAFILRVIERGEDAPHAVER